MSDLPVELRGVTRAFHDGGSMRTILDGIDLDVEAQQIVALMGPSGCGKTTLLSIMGALDSGFSGEAHVLGHRLGELSDDARADLRASEIGFVFQAFHLLDHLTALENVRVAQWLSRDSEGSPELAEAALERVGLGRHGQARVPTLSGGERQRVAIARAMVHRPRLLLADEPTGNLDDRTGAEILDLFEQIRSEDGCSVVVVTHDTQVARRADRVLSIASGRIGPADMTAPA